MVYVLFLLFCLIKYGEFAPLQYQQPLPLPYPLQSSPYNTLNPGNQPFYQNPYLMNTIQSQPEQGIPYYANNDALLRQSGIISAIPFLPIEINIPDLINKIIRAIQAIVGPNFPIISGINAQQQASNIPAAVDPMLRLGQNIGGNVQILPIPIIVLVPQQMKTNLLDEAETKTSQ